MKKILPLLVILLAAHNVQASVVVNQTRVIYPSSAKFVSVQLVNQSDKTHLVQTWIDDGNETASPEQIKVPFSVMPPVVKMQGRSGQVLKIASTNAGQLPKDKESVFWLNMLDVPPIPEGSNDSYLQVAIRNRIKIFYRPDILVAPDNTVGEKISVIQNGRQSCLKNNSPYYMTIPQIINWHGGDLKKKTKDNLVSTTAFIAPFSCASVSDKIKSGGHYRITWLDDYGSKRFTVIH